MHGNRATGVASGDAEAHLACCVIWWDVWETLGSASDGSNALMAWNASLLLG
jgi:hypothetical protein